ncbi:hypothetical protein HMPREF9551_04373, partial [Escherichia coli MS 196-1]
VQVAKFSVPLQYVTAGYPLPARSWQCSLVSWASVSQKHHVLTR